MVALALAWRDTQCRSATTRLKLFNFVLSARHLKLFNFLLSTFTSDLTRALNGQGRRKPSQANASVLARSYLTHVMFVYAHVSQES